MKLSRNTVNRLSHYRKILIRYEYVDHPHIFSHDLARMAGVKPVQVRSDLRAIGFSGNHRKGYHVHELINLINKTLDNGTILRVAMIGAGRLGKAVLSYIQDNPKNFSVVAAFDLDPSMTGKEIAGVRVHHITSLEKVIRDAQIRLAIIATPADDVQEITSLLCDQGIRGFLNFTSERLIVPRDVYVKDCDVITLLEEVGYFSSILR